MEASKPVQKAALLPTKYSVKPGIVIPAYLYASIIVARI